MELLKTNVISRVEAALEAIGGDADLVKNLLQPAREADQGDLTLPCFPFAKALKKSPVSIAEELRAAMENHESIGDINAVNGYLNIRVNPVWLANHLLSVGVDNGMEKAKRSVLIEHTSANPNGPFHVGRARNAILGDTLVRLHRLWGNDVTAEYYVDDMGKQVAVLAWALNALSRDDVEALLEGRDPPTRFGQASPTTNASDGIRPHNSSGRKANNLPRLRKPLERWFMRVKTVMKPCSNRLKRPINPFSTGCSPPLGASASPTTGSPKNRCL